MQSQWLVSITALVFSVIALHYTYITASAAKRNSSNDITKAITLLGAIDKSGNPAIDRRLGGICTLEKIANESDRDYWPIMEILTAYIRKNSSAEKCLKARYISLDIQEILSVIRRRKNYFSNGEFKHLDLQNTCLKGAELSEANLEGADLSEANLEGADLFEANLEGVNLSEANLKRANLEGADLFEANLERADLSEANLKRANLAWSNLRDARLQGTKLRDANLEEALLKGVEIWDENLDGIKELKFDQLSNVKTLYNAKLDDAHLRPLKEKYPALFDEPK